MPCLLQPLLQMLDLLLQLPSSLLSLSQLLLPAALLLPGLLQLALQLPHLTLHSSEAAACSLLKDSGRRCWGEHSKASACQQVKDH